MLNNIYRSKNFFAVPFLVNYLKSFHTWWSGASDKKETFIFPLLNFYPQFGKLDLYLQIYLFSEALKLIKEINGNPAKAPQLKRAYEIMFGLTEVLIEAAPTILIQVVIMCEHPRHKTLNPKGTNH